MFDRRSLSLLGALPVAVLALAGCGGKYAYLCTVPGHAQAGMKGTFTVR